jgi:hypothetical protein
MDRTLQASMAAGRRRVSTYATNKKGDQMKKINTVVEDIHALFKGGHEPDVELLEEMGKKIATSIGKAFRERTKPASVFWMSQIGKRDRQLWLQHRETKAEVFPPNTKIKFMFGDMIEELLLFLVKESGHTVTEEQAVVKIGEATGKKDCKIDGVNTDIKSAASRSFLKFKDGSLLNEGMDPFGYIAQISAYANGEGNGAFLAMDKQFGHIALLEVPEEAMINAPARVKEIRKIVDSEEIPPLCEEPVPDGKSGNMKLAILCSYCPFKKKCFPTMRTFIYSSGPKFLSTVVRTPDVPEVEE